jgi:hypothetical protein
MVLYLRGTCKCPKCGGLQFADGAKPGPDDELTCLECSHVCTIQQAQAAAKAPPGLPRLAQVFEHEGQSLSRPAQNREQ